LSSYFLLALASLLSALVDFLLFFYFGYYLAGVLTVVAV
jgi:hypothetical protein